MEIVVDLAPINKDNFDDGWIRTFREVPKFHKTELKMMTDWLNENNLEAIIIYLGGENYRNLDGEMVDFCYRAFLRGEL